MEELRQAVRDMELGRPAEALPVLSASLGTELPPPVRARVMGLRAQALLMLARPQEARDQVREALKLTRSLGDARGLEQLRGLNGQIYGALAHEAEQSRLRNEERAEMALTDEELLAKAPDEAGRAMVFVRRASFLADEGADEESLAAAKEGLRRAQEHGGPREKVLALLAIARIERAQARSLLQRAHAVADEAEEAQLIAAIARAARSEGIEL